MNLSPEQLDQYDRDGYLFFPNLFDTEEVAALLAEAERVAKIEDECIFREAGSGTAKIMFRLHEEDGPTASRPFRSAARSHRILHTAQQILGDEELYLHHCKVNMKAAVEGSAWAWHQDFGTWYNDGIAKPNMATFMVMLNDANEFNGCLYFLPGSHKIGHSSSQWDESTSYKLWAVKPDDMLGYLREYPDPVAIRGEAGSGAIFHSELLHASGHNLSAENRWQAYFCFNLCANFPVDVENPRPDYVRSQNWEPMVLDTSAITV